MRTERLLLYSYFRSDYNLWHRYLNTIANLLLILLYSRNEILNKSYRLATTIKIKFIEW